MRSPHGRMVWRVHPHGLLRCLVRQSVTRQNVLSYSDGFAIVSLVVVGMLILTALLRSSPRPLSQRGADRR
jgi:hypothetical protein